MVGYLFIFLAVICNAGKTWCTKSISNSVKSVNDSIRVNVARNILCCVLGAALALAKSGSAALRLSAGELGVCLAAGASMAVFLVAWIFAAKSDAYMLVSVCCSASFIVPCLAGLLLFGETLTFPKLLAIALICAAVYFLLRYNTHIKGKISAGNMALLALCLFAQGVNQTVQKLYTHAFPARDVSVYTFYSFVFTLLVLVIFRFVIRDTHPDPEKKLVRRGWPLIAGMAVALFLTSYFQSMAAVRVEALVMYPVLNALSLIAGSLLAVFAFGEKMKRDSVIGIILTFAALILSRL